MNAFIALDVGGTQIKSAIVSSDYRLLSTVRKDDALAKEGSQTIIRNFSDIIRAQAGALTSQGLTMSGIGIAFPGPFDYQKGISLLQGINKYDSIYGLNLRQLLAEECGIPQDCFAFLNDADMFCLGEATFGKGVGFKRSMMVCIGTGVGSGFVENGRLVKEGEHVPENGWIYSLPYKEGILDEYLSATGLSNRIRESGCFPAGITVKAVSDLGRKGDENAVRIFQSFGEALAEVIPPIALRFQAECLVMGGQVAKSSDLFIHNVKAVLAEKGVETRVSADSSVSAMRAVPLLFRESR